MDTMENRQIYGALIPPRYDGTARTVVGRIENAPAGNVIVRIGQEDEPGGSWHQTEHLVMTPEEAAEFARAVLAAALHGRVIVGTLTGAGECPECEGGGIDGDNANCAMCRGTGRVTA